MLQSLEVADIETALSTNGGFTFSFFGKMNPTANDNATLSLLLEWVASTTLDNTSRIWMTLDKNTNQWLETQGQTNGINIGALKHFDQIDDNYRKLLTTL